jgi:ribosomal protein S18 acetylase RimI-like enzyme
VNPSGPDANLVSIHVRRMQEPEARPLAEMSATSEPWLTLRSGVARLLDVIADPARESYVALADGALAGVVVINMTGPFVGYINLLAVTPEWRNRGIGAQLIRFAEERILRDSPNVLLCVSDFNHFAQKLYARLGYERVGELRDYVISGASEILMRKTIGPKYDFKPRTNS